MNTSYSDHVIRERDTFPFFEQKQITNLIPNHKMIITVNISEVTILKTIDSIVSRNGFDKQKRSNNLDESGIV